MKKIKVKQLIDKLNKKDREKLLLIYNSLDTGVSFDLWFFDSFYKGNILPIVSIAFLINELVILLFIDNYKILSTFVLFLAYLFPVILVIGIDSFFKRIPFFFYLNMKIKILIISITMIKK